MPSPPADDDQESFGLAQPDLVLAVLRRSAARGSCGCRPCSSPRRRSSGGVPGRRPSRGCCLRRASLSLATKRLARMFVTQRVAERFGRAAGEIDGRHVMVITECTVTALSAGIEAALHAGGACQSLHSSSSPKQKVKRWEFEKLARSSTPGIARQTLRITRRRARPIVALARKPGPKQPRPHSMSICLRMGPLTRTRLAGRPNRR